MQRIQISIIGGSHQLAAAEMDEREREAESSQKLLQEPFWSWNIFSFLLELEKALTQA